MKPGDIVQRKDGIGEGRLGIFMGSRVFDGTYVCAEVMWFDQKAPNGDIVSTIQTDLLRVVEAA